MLKQHLLACAVWALAFSSGLCQETPNTPNTATDNPAQEKAKPASQNPPPKKEEKEPIDVVATPTRTKSLRAATAASIDVITSDDLEQQQTHTVADALRQIPGLDIVQSGTPGQATSIFTRGTESNHTSFLLNGRRLQSGLLGGYDLANFGVDNIGRIEVWRGPTSQQYGDDGIGGTINMLTRDARGTEGVHGGAGFESGSFDTFHENGDLYGSQGPVDFSLAGSRWDSEFPRANNDYHLGTINGTLGFQASKDVYVDVLVYYSLANGGDPGDLRFGNNPNNSLLIENWLVSPEITWQTTDFWEQKVFYSFAPERVVANEPDFGNLDRTQINQTQVEYQSTFQVAHNWQLLGGFNYVSSDVHRDSFGVTNIDQNLSSESAFFQSQWEALPNWNIINAIRFDHYSPFGNPITWRAGTSYKIPEIQTLLHFNYGTAYATPTPGDLYFPPFFGFPTSNPNLVPEESEGWEVGVEQPLWDKRITLTSTYFHNDIKNLIVLDSSFVPQNIASATTEGVENSAKIRALDNLTFDFSYTYLTAENTQMNVRLIRRPRNTFGATVVYLPVPAVTLTMGCLYVNGREDGVNIDIPDYFTARAAAAWQVRPWLQVFARVENLSNTHYEETLGYPALGQAAYGGFKMSF